MAMAERAPWEMIVVPAGCCSSSTAAATRPTASGSSASNGGCGSRKSATLGSARRGRSCSRRRRGSPASLARASCEHHVGALLADHHRRDARVDRRQERHHRSVGDPQAQRRRAPAAAGRATADRVVVRAHLRGARRVVDGVVGLVHVVDQLVVGLRVGPGRQLRPGPLGHRATARRSCAPAARRTPSRARRGPRGR